MKDNKFIVQPFRNKRNNQISLAVLRTRTSDKLLDLFEDEDVKFCELKINKIFKKDKKNKILDVKI